MNVVERNDSTFFALVLNGNRSRVSNFISEVELNKIVLNV